MGFIVRETIVLIVHQQPYLKHCAGKYECKCRKRNNMWPLILQAIYLFNSLSNFFLVCSLSCIIVSPAFVRCARRYGTTEQTKDKKAFEESFDDIWLSPAVSHSPLCRRGTEGMHNQLSGLYKLFTFLKVKDYTRFTAGRTAHIPAAHL